MIYLYVAFTEVLVVIIVSIAAFHSIYVVFTTIYNSIYIASGIGNLEMI